MEIEFNDTLFEEWAERALLHAVYGGADFGECQTTGERITDGDRTSWFDEWTETADRVAAIARESENGGHTVSAREAYLRASNYYRTAYPFLYGAPTDERLVEAFEKETDAFRSAAALFDPPAEPVEIPYGGTTLPGYFYRIDDADRPRPTLVATNGYDSTIQELHFAHAVAAVRRGYNCLTFDGPGQGAPLIEEGLTMRPDWENVVTPVVDYAVSRPEVDSDRIALTGWSLGGHLSPRAATGEHRLAACIADPGLWDLLEMMKGMVVSVGVPQDVADRLPDVDSDELEPMFDAIEASPELTWTIEQRGLWVTGSIRFWTTFERCRSTRSKVEPDRSSVRRWLRRRKTTRCRPPPRICTTPSTVRRNCNGSRPPKVLATTAKCTGENSITNARSTGSTGLSGTRGDRPTGTSRIESWTHHNVVHDSS